METIRDCQKLAAGRGVERGDADLLLAHALGRGRSWLIAHADDALGPDARSTFARLLERRAAGEPVAYILGRRGFWTFELDVTPATLIPRPETELLVELALARMPADAALRVADLGTGSGAVALALARERPQAEVIAVDVSAAALAVARRNARRLELANVSCVRGDWLSPLAGARLDLIVSNPPYVEAGDAHLARGDLRFEPRLALVAGSDGLDAIRRIVAAAPACLRPGGWLLFEHGWNQGAAARALLERAGYADPFTAQDLEHRDRVSGGRVAVRRP